MQTKSYFKYLTKNNALFSFNNKLFLSLQQFSINNVFFLKTISIPECYSNFIFLKKWLLFHLFGFGCELGGKDLTEFVGVNSVLSLGRRHTMYSWVCETRKKNVWLQLKNLECDGIWVLKTFKTRKFWNSSFGLIGYLTIKMENLGAV